MFLRPVLFVYIRMSSTVPTNAHFSPLTMKWIGFKTIWAIVGCANVSFGQITHTHTTATSMTCSHWALNFDVKVWNWSQRYLGWKMLAEFLHFLWRLCGSFYTELWSVIQRSSSYQQQPLCVNMFPQQSFLLNTSSSEVVWSCCQSQGTILAQKYCFDSSAACFLECWIPGQEEPAWISLSTVRKIQSHPSSIIARTWKWSPVPYFLH